MQWGAVENSKGQCKNKPLFIDLLYYSCFENNRISLLPFNFSILITSCQDQGTHIMQKKVKDTLVCSLTRQWHVSWTVGTHAYKIAPTQPLGTGPPEKYSLMGHDSLRQIYLRGMKKKVCVRGWGSGGFSSNIQRDR